MQNILKIVLDISSHIWYNRGMEKTNRWTDKQVKMLKKFYGDMELQDISHMLGKTPSAVTSKVHYLRRRGWAFNSTRR
jgi:hypothetical protein